MSAPLSENTSCVPRGYQATFSLSPSTIPPQPSPLYPPLGPLSMQHAPSFLPLTPTSSQTTANNIYHQSYNTADSLSSSNGTNTQITSRTGRAAVSAQASRANASRNEALSFVAQLVSEMPGPQAAANALNPVVLLLASVMLNVAMALMATMALSGALVGNATLAQTGRCEQLIIECFTR